MLHSVIASGAEGAHQAFCSVPHPAVGIYRVFSSNETHFLISREEAQRWTVFYLIISKYATSVWPATVAQTLLAWLGVLGRRPLWEVTVPRCPAYHCGRMSACTVQGGLLRERWAVSQVLDSTPAAYIFRILPPGRFAPLLWSLIWSLHISLCTLGCLSYSLC